VAVELAARGVVGGGLDQARDVHLEAAAPVEACSALETRA
jgi:hypothetical protein